MLLLIQMKQSEPITVPLDVCVNLNEAITKAKIISETMSQRINKLNQDYRRTVNTYYIDYIDYRTLLDTQFVVDTSPASSPMILISNMFKENETQFFEMIKFFKNNPTKLADALVSTLSPERKQRIIDFVYQGLFPCFLNSTCLCKQHLRVYSFTLRALLQEFETVSESHSFIDVSNLADKVLKALTKKSDTFRFYRTLLVKSAKILTGPCSLERKEDNLLQTRVNDLGDKLQQDRKTSGPWLQSKRYKQLLENYWLRQGVEFTSFIKCVTNPAATQTQEEVMVDKLMRSLSVCYQVSVPMHRVSSVNISFVNNVPIAPASHDPSQAFIDMLVSVVKRYLPLEVKHFFYLMRIICDTLQTPYPKVVSMYFIRGILISCAENVEGYFNFEESKALDRNNIRSLIDLIIPLCAGLLDLKHGQANLTAFLDALTDVPETIRQLDIEQINEFRETVKTQMKDASYFEMMKSQLLGTASAGEGVNTLLPPIQLIPDERTENLSTRRKTNASKFKKNNSVIFSNNSGIIKRELKELNKDYYKNCNFHIETICIRLGELAEMVDLYNLTRDSNDSSMSLDLYNNLTMILKNVEKDNTKAEADKLIYIIFYDNITNPDGNRKIGKPNGQPAIANILANEFVSKELLERFSERSFRDLVNYGLQNWMFDDPTLFESRADFAAYKYDLKLKSIFIGKKSGKSLSRETSNRKRSYSGSDTINTAITPPDRSTDDGEQPSSSKPSEKQAEDITDGPQLIERLRNATLYYSAFDNDITTKNYQLGAKKHEIFVATNESFKLKEFRKSIIELRIFKDFDRLLREFNVDICVSCDASIVNKMSTVNYQATRAANCPQPATATIWSAVCSSASGELLNKQALAESQHFHLERFHEVMQFLNFARVPALFVELNRHNDLLKAVIEGLLKMFEAQLDRISEKHLQTEYKKVVAKDQTLNSLFSTFLSSKFNSQLFPQNLTLLDDGFRLACEVMSHLQLSDLGKIKNSEVVQANLSGPIKKISKLSTVLSYEAIMLTLQEIMQKISAIISGINKAGAGGDDLIPSFIYCIIQARPSNWISMFKYIDLFMHSSNSKGWQGYILTQVEISIHKIEQLQEDIAASPPLAQRVLERESVLGLSLLRVRDHRTVIETPVSETLNIVF